MNDLEIPTPVLRRFWPVLGLQIAAAVVERILRVFELH